MALTHETFAPPILLAGWLQGQALNTRSRSRLGSVPGGGVITWAAFEHSAGMPIQYVANLYFDSALHQDLTNHGGTTPLEGTPIFPATDDLRGCKGILIPSSNTLALYELHYRLPPGPQHLYLCAGSTQNYTLYLHCMIGYQLL